MSSGISYVGSLGCSLCMSGADEWLLARGWGQQTARAIGARHQEWAEDVVVRVLAMVRASWPCTHAVVPAPRDPEAPYRQAPALGPAFGDGEATVVSPGVRARLHGALTNYLSGVEGERAVLDVLKDALGDEPRRVAADGPFTSRPERVLAERFVTERELVEWVPDEQERAVAVTLIGAVQSYRHATGALWALDGCPAAETAEYVGTAVGSRRGVGSGGHVLAGVEASELAAMAVTSRHAVRRALPDRWAGLQEMARAVLATAPVGPDGLDRLDGEDRAESEVDSQALLLRALTDDEVLAAGGDFEDFVVVLDRLCLLPRQEARRAERLTELRPLWASYRRSRQGRR